MAQPESKNEEAYFIDPPTMVPKLWRNLETSPLNLKHPKALRLSYFRARTHNHEPSNKRMVIQPPLAYEPLA